MAPDCHPPSTTSMQSTQVSISQLNLPIAIHIVKDQIQVCNIIQKRFTKQSQNARVNAQGVAKKRLQ